MDRNRERPKLPEGITVRSAKSIGITFEFRGVRCRETIKLAPTPSNIKRVAQHRASILDAIARGTFDYGTTFPDSARASQFAEYKGAGYRLSDYLTNWLELRKPRYKASTYANYSRTIRNVLIPEFGNINLSDIRISHARDWANKQKCTVKTVTNQLFVLKTSLQDAVNDELIPTNPLKEWQFTRLEAPREVDDVDPFTAEEMKIILASCRDPQHRNLFEFAFWTGLRTSELVAVEWGDIDWRKGTVRISRAKTRAAKVPEVTKTRKSTRDVTLLAPALAALDRQKQWTFLADGVIFHNPNIGKAWHSDHKIRLAWVSALKAAGIRYRRPYQTRHTYASMMLTAGENPSWIASQLGHSDLSMLSRIYGRWIPSAVPDAGAKAVALFCANPATLPATLPVTLQGHSGHILGHKEKAVS